MEAVVTAVCNLTTSCEVFFLPKEKVLADSEICTLSL